MATAFETEMGVMPEISKAVHELGWILPTDIQGEAVPLILGGGDVLMAAETGSGKTGAFCLPVIQIVYETLKTMDETKGSKSRPISNKKFVLNAYDRTEAVAIDSNGLLCQSRDSSKWHGARANFGVKNSGRYYYEAVITDDGLCRVGWSNLSASHDIGTDGHSFGFGGTGKKSHQRQFDNYGTSFGKGDTIGCFLDIDHGAISWSKNGERFEKAYDVPGAMKQNGLFPSVSLKNAELNFNFGDNKFNYPPPSGWLPVNAADPQNLVESKYKATSDVSLSKRKNNAPLAIIIEPSRELAEQTYEQLKKFKRYVTNPCPKEVLLIGGANPAQQLDAIKSGVDIVVATPGRLDDLLSSQSLILSHCRFFILDECDALLSSGYTEMINRIHRQIPKVSSDGNRLQMIVCSATLHSMDVKRLANKLMHFPTWIDLKGQDSVPETVHHVVCRVDPSADTSWKQLLNSRDKLQTDRVHNQDRLNVNNPTPETLSEAVKLLKGAYVIRAIQKQNMDRAIIFCRTKLDCDNLEQFFIAHGGGPHHRESPFSCVCLHSDRAPPERKSNLEKFKKKEVRFLICTDVAARGLDITGLPYVINVTLPDEKQNYVHRIGRVGRAERMGLAISLVSNVKEKVWYHSNCTTKGRGCYNTNLLEQGGCCIWYNELKILDDVEEHLGITIDSVDNQFSVPMNAFDGKVVYGQKLKQSNTTYNTHIDVLASAVKDLNQLEQKAQFSYLRLRYGDELSV